MNKEELKLLDEFAGQALGGWVSRLACNGQAHEELKKAGVEEAEIPGFIAHTCYGLALAMVQYRRRFSPKKQRTQEENKGNPS